MASGVRGGRSGKKKKKSKKCRFGTISAVFWTRRYQNGMGPKRPSDRNGTRPQVTRVKVLRKSIEVRDGRRTFWVERTSWYHKKKCGTRTSEKTAGTVPERYGTKTSIGPGVHKMYEDGGTCGRRPKVVRATAADKIGPDGAPSSVHEVRNKHRSK